MWAIALLALITIPVQLVETDMCSIMAVVLSVCFLALGWLLVAVALHVYHLLTLFPLQMAPASSVMSLIAPTAPITVPRHVLFALCLFPSLLLCNVSPLALLIVFPAIKPTVLHVLCFIT